MTKRKLTLRCLCEGAIMLALAQVLGYIKLWQLPNGGSVTLSMLPIFVFCIRWGFGPGLLVSFAFGLLQLFLDVAYSAGWQSIIGDYLLAFAVMGFAGLFKGKKNGIYWGSRLYAVHPYYRKRAAFRQALFLPHSPKAAEFF